MSDARLDYAIVKLDDVLRYYAKDLEPSETGRRVIRVESFVDIRKGVIVFEICSTAKDDSDDGK